MLSILVPTYNRVCLPLVKTLQHQAIAAGIVFELLLADDASQEEFREQNRQMNDLPGCRYLQLNENIGPARIRNYLAQAAQYPYLLFLDDDSMPVSDTFVADYLAAAQEGVVICGGFVYPRQQPAADAILRYVYGVEVEERLCREGYLAQRPSFFGICFLLPAEVLARVPFDPGFGFGYEDLAFGVRLIQAGVTIHYIQNPVYHLVVETSEQYLAKTRRAVRNLANHIEQMQSYVRLLQWYITLRRFHLLPLVAFLYRFNEQRLAHHLMGPHPSLKLFAFYKLGYLSTL